MNGNHPERRENRLTDEYIDVIIKPMMGLDFLKKLDLSFNEIGDKGAKLIAQFLQVSLFTKV